MSLGRITIAAASGIAGFSLLLLIISVATPVWLDGGSGNTVGIFRKCYGDNTVGTTAPSGPGCYNENRAPQAGLSVFGLLLLAFAIMAAIATMFVDNFYILWAALGLLYFASIFIMSAYATWAGYSRDPETYLFPRIVSGTVSYTSIGYSYNLCVASHFFLWTALTLLAFGAGYKFAESRGVAT